MLLQELPARKIIPKGWPSTCLRCAAGQGVPGCHQLSLGCCSPVPEAQQTHCTFGSPGTGWDTLQDVSHCSSRPSPSHKCSSLWVLQEQRVQDAQKGLGVTQSAAPAHEKPCGDSSVLTSLSPAEAWLHPQDTQAGSHCSGTPQQSWAASSLQGEEEESGPQTDT